MPALEQRRAALGVVLAMAETIRTLGSVPSANSTAPSKASSTTSSRSTARMPSRRSVRTTCGRTRRARRGSATA